MYTLSSFAEPKDTPVDGVPRVVTNCRVPALSIDEGAVLILTGVFIKTQAKALVCCIPDPKIEVEDSRFEIL
jgi:hypothetical protein